MGRSRRPSGHFGCTIAAIIDRPSHYRDCSADRRPNLEEVAMLEVLYRRRDAIVTLTLNRPETLNAMNEAMMGEMERILIEIEADSAVRAVILTGAGRAFSSGGDQK